MSSTFRRTVFPAFFTLAVSFSLQAQSDSSAAHLSGQITDASGYGVAFVRVVARPEGTHSSQIY